MTVGEGKLSAGIACLPHLCVVGAVPRVCNHLLNICVSHSTSGFKLVLNMQPDI